MYVQALLYLHVNCLKASYTWICLQPPSGIVWGYWLKKNEDQVLAWKSGHTVLLLPHGPTCPLQTILLGDLVRYNSLLQIRAVRRVFYFI